MTKRDLCQYALVHIGRAHQLVWKISDNPDAVNLDGTARGNPEDFDPTEVIAELSTAVDFLRRVKPATIDSQRVFSLGQQSVGLAQTQTGLAPQGTSLAQAAVKNWQGSLGGLRNGEP